MSQGLLTLVIGYAKIAAAIERHGSFIKIEEANIAPETRTEIIEPYQVSCVHAYYM